VQAVDRVLEQLERSGRMAQKTTNASAG
jgi:hypothetical protein